MDDKHRHMYYANPLASDIKSLGTVDYEYLYSKANKGPLEELTDGRCIVKWCKHCGNPLADLGIPHVLREYDDFMSYLDTVRKEEPL